MGKLIVVKDVRDIVIITFLFDEINFEERELLKKELSELIENGGTRFIIDFSKIGFVSSLVISVIVFFAKEVRKNNGSMKLSGLSGAALSIFELTHFDRIFELYDTEEKAVESYGITG